MSDDLEQACFEAQAQRLLEHAKDLPPRDPIRRYNSLLRLWHFPRHGSQTSWTILKPGKKAPEGSLPMVREVVWDRAKPDLRVSDANLTVIELEHWIEEGLKLAVPVLAFGHRVGMDGEFFGLETYEASPFVRAQWWNEGPAEWRHFVDWVNALRGFLKALCGRTG